MALPDGFGVALGRIDQAGPFIGPLDDYGDRAGLRCSEQLEPERCRAGEGALDCEHVVVDHSQPRGAGFGEECPYQPGTGIA
jgi:hypothetical protein